MDYTVLFREAGYQSIPHIEVDWSEPIPGILQYRLYTVLFREANRLHDIV